MMDAVTLDDAAWHCVRQSWRERVLIKFMGHTSACWLWLAWNTGKGHGKVKVAGKSRPAHTAFFEAAGGVVPSGMVRDHLCRQRGCVRPSHGETVTVRENTLRGEAKLFKRKAELTQSPNAD